MVCITYGVRYKIEVDPTRSYWRSFTTTNLIPVTNRTFIRDLIRSNNLSNKGYLNVLSDIKIWVNHLTLSSYQS